MDSYPLHKHSPVIVLSTLDVVFQFIFGLIIPCQTSASFSNAPLSLDWFLSQSGKSNLTLCNQIRFPRGLCDDRGNYI
jgi:hypothetical protein